MIKMANIELIRKLIMWKKDQSGSYQKTWGIHDRRFGKHWNRMRFLAIPEPPPSKGQRSMPSNP